MIHSWFITLSLALALVHGAVRADIASNTENLEILIDSSGENDAAIQPVESVSGLEESAEVPKNDLDLVNGTSDTTGDVNVVPVEESTSVNDTSTTDSAVKRARPTKVECLRRNQTEPLELVVHIMNQTSHLDLFKTIPNMTVAPCSLILFYAPFCPFSAAAAPHFNALPRLYPDITCVAIDSSTYVSINARYGTVALPTLYLFHNGYPVAKFNESAYTLDRFVAFVLKYASVEPDGQANVTSADFVGPLSSVPTHDSDWLLWLAWIFVFACTGYGVTKLSLWHRMLECLRNNWQEAEAQHEHAE